MNRHIPSDLLEALELLESFERSKDHSERTRYFTDAVEILNGHLQDSPDSPHRAVAKNLKRAYTRRLLEELPSLSSLDIISWFDYSKLLLISVCKEVQELGKVYPNLDKNKQDFLTIWAEEAIVLLKKGKKRGQ